MIYHWGFIVIELNRIHNEIMTCGSLFSGIGGFDLAAEWAGFTNIFQVEIDDYCQKVLAKNFPNVKRYKDIKEFNGEEYRGTIDIISGGFPCQPFSIAGKQKGKEDDRNLWPEMFRVITEIGPTWIVGENVPNLTNFMEFENMCLDLERENYEVQPVIIPACAVDAKHRRDRVWIIAYSNDTGNRSFGNGNNENGTAENERWREQPQHRIGGLCKDVADSEGKRINGIIRNIEQEKSRDDEFNGSRQDVADSKRTGLEGSKSTGDPCAGGLSTELCKDVADSANSGAERMCGRKNTTANWLPEPDVGRVANGIPHRVDRLKGLGNAIVPQVAYEIFKAINHTQRRTP